MCSLYKQKLKKAVTPPQWGLDKKGCPIYSATLASSEAEFKSYCETMRGGDYLMKNIVVKMVASIERLYESINKRAILTSPLPHMRYRADGFEAMFFSELAQWLCADLPLYSVTEQSTADLVGDRITYCKDVKATVFFHRGDADKNNPTNQLDRIIDNLIDLHKDILKSIKAASFNNSIEAINRELKNMVVNAFDVCHLILEDVNQRELQVDQFLNPRSVDTKVKALLKTSMGQWIALTLRAAGITGNNFESGEEITLTAIDNHLITDFTKIELNSTGLLEFARLNKDFAITRLLQVITIHRSILNLCYMRASLVLAARVGVKEGENWAYGNDEGKTVVNALLIVIEDARQQFQKTIELFWNDFYSKGYLPYAKQHKINTIDPTYRKLYEANGRVEVIKRCGEKIKQTIDIIAASMADFKGDAKITKQKKRILISHLNACMHRIADVDQKVLDEITQLSEHEVISALALISKKMEPYIVKFPLENVPIYQQAKARLLGNAAFPRDLSLMKKPARFYTDTQKLLYNNLLFAYHGAVVAWPGFSIFYGVGWDIDAFRTLYSHFNAIMSAIYAPRIIDGYTLCLLSDLVNIEKNKLYITMGDDSITYHVKDRDEEGHTGVIPITEIDAAFEMPITFDKLQLYVLEILAITSQKGHTYTTPESVPEDDVFYQLYKSGQKKTEFFWKIEMQLIDQCCKMALHQFARKVKQKTYNVLATEGDFKLLQVGISGENIEISIDKNLLTYAGGAFSVELENYKCELARTKQMLEDRKQSAALINEEQKNIIIQRDSALVDAAREIDRLVDEKARVDQQTANFVHEISLKDERIAKQREQEVHLSKALACKDKQLASKDEQLASKDEQLASKDEQLASKDIEATELMKKIVSLTEKIAKLEDVQDSPMIPTAHSPNAVQENPAPVSAGLNRHGHFSGSEAEARPPLEQAAKMFATK